MASFKRVLGEVLSYSKHPHTFIAGTMYDLIARYHELGRNECGHHVYSPRLTNPDTLDFFAFIALADCLLESTER